MTNLVSKVVDYGENVWVQVLSNSLGIFLIDTFFKYSVTCIVSYSRNRCAEQVGMVGISGLCYGCFKVKSQL